MTQETPAQKTFREHQDAQDRAAIAETQRENLDHLHQAFPEHAPDIDRIAYSLQNALYAYLARPGSDPEVLWLMEGLVRNIEVLCTQGDTDEPLSHRYENELKSGLAGATMLFEPNREYRRTDTQPAEHAPLLHDFLRLVRTRVGEITDPDADIARLHMRIDPRQAGPTITHRGVKEQS